MLQQRNIQNNANCIVIPHRSTPKWESQVATQASTREIVEKVITGKLPVGIVPFELITEDERLYNLQQLSKLEAKKYDNTCEQERVLVYGNPYVDFKSVEEYLKSKNTISFNKVRLPLLKKCINYFAAFGFNVMPLIDPVTNKPYPAGVVRHIHLPNDCYTEDDKNCTVLHKDCILYDSKDKKDFRLPKGFDAANFHQFSICLQLEDGGYTPDYLHVYEKLYSPELDEYFFGEGKWRFPNERLNKVNKYSHLPELRKAYFFSTLNFHDVAGGHPLSNRINFSVFFLYNPSTNTLFYYN